MDLGDTVQPITVVLMGCWEAYVSWCVSGWGAHGK